MAQYNRSFLVPYLENLCALLLAKDELAEFYGEMASENFGLEVESNRLKPPQEPYLEETGLQSFGMIVGGILVVVSWMDILIISFLAGLAGWFMLVVGTIWFISTKRANARREEAYREEYYKYAYQRRELDKALEVSRKEVAAYQKSYEKKSAQLDAVIEKVFSANIIPRRYRDKYAVAYLYDWFSTGGSDDLDMALNTYVLEEIKERLDIVIEQLSQSLLNQQIMIARQYQMEDNQERYHREMMGKLDQMQISADEQSRYLSMIEANTSAMTFLATVDYIRKS